MRVNELVKFIRERHAVYLRKSSGQPKPWTSDPILQQYRFCNVYRELDTVSIWIRKNWREGNSHDSLLWFAMVVARIFNWPPTLQAIGYPIPYSGVGVRTIVKRMQSRAEKVYTGAYMVRASPAGPGEDKVDYLTKDVFGPMWRNRSELSRRINFLSLEVAHTALMEQFGMGSFFAGQIVADLKYTPFLANAKDWDTWAAMGPGSARGLNRVLARPLKTRWNQKEWLANLQVLRILVNRELRKSRRSLPTTMKVLHAQDLQNCLCEFDKYERTRLGEGRPRSRYNGL